jgi:glycosyltransferase involved in cell wall biosynthesis
VQVVIRDLVRWLEYSGRRVHLVYPAPLPSVRSTERINPWGRKGLYVPMPAVVRNSILISLPLFLAYSPIAFFHLSRLIRRAKIDLINCHFLTPYFIHLVIAARLLRVPIVISVHGSDITDLANARWVDKFVCREIMRGADRIVACSEALAKRTSTIFPEVRAKISRVYNALDDARFTTVRELDSVPSTFVLCVCRHVYLKGVDTLLRAFASIHNIVPGLSLVLIGDGPLLSEHKALADTLEIRDRVIFIGGVGHSDLPSFFSKCSLFVLPSRAEAFGLVLLEAAFHGKPIICTRVGGLPEIISNDVNGILVDADEPREMAAQMLTLLQNNEVAQRLGKAAHETVLSHFLWRDRINDYIDVYEGRPEPSHAHGMREVLRRTP